MLSRKWILASLVIASTAIAADQAVPASSTAQPVFRKPFMLEVRVDKDRVWRENFGPVPYVYENGVYLFPGERFGVKLDVKDGAIAGISYVSDADKADVSFEFSQDLQDDKATATLKLINHTTHSLTMRALMMVPGEKKPVETSILPLNAGMTNFESWPQALRQLLVYEIQIVS